MNIFKDSDELYPLQTQWNLLEPADALTYDQYELAKLTNISSEAWSKFLRDGQVQKYIERETQLFKEAQMRKLIQRATTNDKSVGTAQMLNAIGKTIEDDSAETSFFIYTHVPLTDVESAAKHTAVDERWQPTEVKEEVQQRAIVNNSEVHSTAKEVKNIDEDDWF